MTSTRKLTAPLPASPPRAGFLVPLADERRPVVLLPEPVQQRRRMRGSDDLRLGRLGLTAQKFQQESRTTRVDPVLDFLDRHQIGHVRLEERGGERREAQGTVAEDRRETPCRSLAARRAVRPWRPAARRRHPPPRDEVAGARTDRGLLRVAILADRLYQSCEVLPPFAHALHFGNCGVGPQHRQLRRHRLDVRQQPGHTASVVPAMCRRGFRPLQVRKVFHPTKAVVPLTTRKLSE